MYSNINTTRKPKPKMSTLVDRYTTHDQIASSCLLVRHYLSDLLLHRAMFALIDVVPDNKCWEWMENVDITNITEGADPMFNAIINHMNAQTTFQYDISWNTKPVFVWLMRQLRHIAKYGNMHYKSVYMIYPVNMNVSGLWELEKDSIHLYEDAIRLLSQ